MISRFHLSQKKIRFVIPKPVYNKQTQDNLSWHFLYDHDKFNEVIEELVVAIDKLDYHHQYYAHHPSKIKGVINE